MRVIDLLNKIANGEEVPKRIKYNNKNWNYKDGILEYISDETWFCLSNFEFDELNEEVEIIEPQLTEEEINEYTNKFLEAWEPISKQFGKLFDELIRIKNDLGLNLEENTKELQEHKIPEKFEIYDNSIDWCCNDRPITDNEKDIMDKINEIIDYLEGKR